MANYKWTDFANGTVLAFTPSVDTFLFDDSSISAATVGFDSYVTQSSFSYGGKTITLLTPPATLTSANITFANGSTLLVGDESVSTTNDPGGNTLTGTAGADQLVGLWGDDTLDGGAGADKLVGGWGADVYVVSDASDQVVELSVVRVNTASDGTQANAAIVSFHPVLSGDGRYVVFDSDASNLVAGDTNSATDVFLKDLQTGAISRVSVSADGTQAMSFSYAADISADGRYVAFSSGADLIAKTPGGSWIFVKDLQTGAVTLASASAGGVPADQQVSNPSLSENGRFVAFWTSSDKLVPGDTNGAIDVFVKDLQTGAIVRASTDANGAQGNDGSGSYEGALSADGRYVVFDSNASNLVPNDTNNAADVFLKDLQTGAVTRISVTSDGAEGNGTSDRSSISQDGRYVVFESAASNLVAGDTNGYTDIFLKDVQSGGLTRISTSSDNAQANGGPSVYPAISADGAFAVFESYASNLVTGGLGFVGDVYLKDLGTGEIVRVNVAPDGALANQVSISLPSLSGDGTFVVFPSNAYNLATGDTNALADIFVADLSRDTVQSAAQSFVLPQSVENLILVESALSGTGNALDNAVTGNALANTLNGGLGNDTLDGGGGGDLLAGDSGNDFLVGGDGNDYLDGGSGFDYVDYTSAASGVTVNLATGAVSGGAGNDTVVGIEYVQGSGFDDVLTGGAGNEVLSGGSGNDYLYGSSGNDELNGGAGADYADYLSAAFGVTADLAAGTASGGGGNDTLVGIEYVLGSGYNDTIRGDALGNWIDGREGTDDLAGNAGNDALLGGPGTDYLVGGEGDDYLDGGAGFDYVDYTSAASGVTVNLATGVVSGGAGNDTLVAIEYVQGSSFGDVLSGGAGNEVLSGGAGNDYLYGSAGNDELNGGAGADYADYLSAAYGVTADLAAGTASGGAGNDILVGIEYLIGGGYNDTLRGDALGNWLDGREGNDDLSGNAGNDALLGGAGNDHLDGGSEDDYVDGGSGSDVSLGGLGSDYLVGDAGDDYLDGGAGFDYVDYTSAASGVTVNLATGVVSGGAGNDTVVAIEYVQGSGFGDALSGGAGNEVLSGGAGNDYLYGSAGNDELNGGAGADYADYLSAAYGVTADLAAGTASGGAGNDILVGIEYLLGGGYNDTLRGDALGNWLDGREGNDDLSGNAGNDALLGGAGNDQLLGGVGADVLIGGAGADTFVLRPGDGGATLNLADLITDYQDGSDLIGLGGGLTFADLTITQGTGPNASDAIIQKTASGEYLAILQNVNSSLLNSLDFIQV